MIAANAACGEGSRDTGQADTATIPHPYNRQPCVQSTQLTLLMTVGMHLPDRTLRKLPGGDTKLQEHLWQVWIILWHTGISVAQVLRLA
jgi:hypothetical protein